MGQHKTRRQEYAEETYRDLVFVARNLFAKQGYSKTSIDLVVESANLTKGALYHHFANKTALFAACYESQAQEVAQTLQQIPVDSPVDADPERVWKSSLERCRRFLTLGKKSTGHLISLQEAMTVLGWDQWREIDMRYTMGLVRESIDTLMEVGLIRRRSVDLVSQLVYGLLVESSMVIARSKDKDVAQKETFELVSNMLESLKE